MVQFFEIFFVFLSGYIVTAGLLSLHEGDFKHLRIAGILFAILYFPVMKMYSDTLEWHLENRALLLIYKEYFNVLIIGLIVALIQISVGEEYISRIFKRKEIIIKPPVRGVRNNIMGSASSNFDDKSLDIQSITVIKLTHSAFGHLDRQVSASIEANLNIRPNQRKTVQRLIAEVINQKPNVAEALRPLNRVGHGRHNAPYGIFDKVCMITAQSQRYSKKTLDNLISIAQQLGLSQDEIYYLFQKSRLAV